MLAKSNLSKSTFLLFFIAYFTNLHGIVPPKEGKFPTEILEQFAEQEIGITYGDSGWVRKLYDWRNNPYRDAQLEFHMPQKV